MRQTAGPYSQQPHPTYFLGSGSANTLTHSFHPQHARAFSGLMNMTTPYNNFPASHMPQQQLHFPMLSGSSLVGDMPQQNYQYYGAQNSPSSTTYTNMRDRPGLMAQTGADSLNFDYANVERSVLLPLPRRNRIEACGPGTEAAPQPGHPITVQGQQLVLKPGETTHQFALRLAAARLDYANAHGFLSYYLVDNPVDSRVFEVPSPKMEQKNIAIAYQGFISGSRRSSA